MLLNLVFLAVTIAFYSCSGGSSKAPAEDEGDDFAQGQTSTVVTGSNLTTVTTDCKHGSDPDSDFQNLSCKMLLKSDDSTESEETLTLTYDGFNAVTAVDGIEVAWGVPPELGLTCSRVRQATELFCFRLSTETLQDFSVLLELTDIADSSVSIRVISTAVSTTIDQSTPPEAPSNLTATTVSADRINLAFTDNSDTETSFSIERSLDEAVWSSLASVAADVVVYANTGLANSTTYFYRVRACNGSGCSAYSNTASDTTDASGGSGHIIFVTSGAYDGNLGGLSGADVICGNVAAAGGLTGNWKAILSTSTVNAKDRITISGNILDRNSQVVANDSTDLWDGSIDNFVEYDESANFVPPDTVWTGSLTDGTGGGVFSCGDWTNDLSGLGTSGLTNSSGNSWIYHTDNNCTDSYHIYCIDGQ